MTARIYRYTRSLDTTRMQRLVNGAPTLSASSPNYVDVSGDDSNTNQKTNLDEYMKTQGFDYLSTDPGNTPTAAAATALGSAAFDVRDVLAWDHFISGSVTSERSGNLGWLNIASGTNATLAFSGEAGHPGIASLSPGTTAAGRAAIYLGDTTLLNLLLSSVQNQMDHEWLFRLDTNSLSAVNNERFTLGFGDTFDASASTELNNGVYLEFNPTLSGNFKLVTCNNGTRTRTDTTLAPTANNWYRLVLSMTYPGSVPTAVLSINGTQRCTATANIPTAQVGFGARMDANATSNKGTFSLDYSKLTQVTSKET